MFRADRSRYVFMGQRGCVVVRGFVIFHNLCVERDFIAECVYNMCFGVFVREVEDDKWRSRAW